MDEMWSFCKDKKHQVWLWWAIDHETSEVIAYWFGTREYKHLDKLLELLEPLLIAKVYTDGNDAYYERFDSDVLVWYRRSIRRRLSGSTCRYGRGAVDWYAKAFVFPSPC